MGGGGSKKFGNPGGRGGGGQKMLPSIWGMWIFSGITLYGPPPAVRIIQENLFCWFSLVTSVFTVGLRPFSNF